MQSLRDDVDRDLSPGWFAGTSFSGLLTLRAERGSKTDREDVPRYTLRVRKVSVMSEVYDCSEEVKWIANSCKHN